MTPIDHLERGTYKLRFFVTNPAGCARADDWRQKPSWCAGDKFYCFDFYVGIGRTIPALHMGRPGSMVSETCMPEIFNLIAPHLEKV